MPTVPKYPGLTQFCLSEVRPAEAAVSKTNPLVQALSLADTYGGDAIRFWCARAISFGHDGSTSLESIGERYDRELANDLGNLVSRTTAMIARYRGGQIPDARNDLAGDLAQLATVVPELLDAWDITGALETIWEVVRRLNKYVEERKPWELAKDDARAADLDETLFTLVDGLRVLAVALSPYLPETAPRILEALGQDPELAWENVAPDRTRAADGIEPAQPLFPRIEAPTPA